MGTQSDELSRADVAGLVLHGVEDPMALVTVVRGLDDGQVREALYETLSLFAGVVRANDLGWMLRAVIAGVGPG